jgi:hypothetical protein
VDDEEPLVSQGDEVGGQVSDGLGAGPPPPSAAVIREALLSLDGTQIEDLKLPLPSQLKDIAKASDLVSGVVEERVPALLNSMRATTWDEDGIYADYEFRKFDIGFPDILLVKRSDPRVVLFEIEAKSWYILSRDPLTARFLTSASVIGEGTLVVLVAWMLGGVVSGSPVLLRMHVDDAIRLAAVRDTSWTAMNPAGSHRVVEPENAPDATRNLLKTQVRGELKTAVGTWAKDSDNFGKLNRLYDPQIQAFRESVLSLSAAGKSLRAWREFIKKSSEA